MASPFIVYCFILTFLTYLVKDAEIFSPIRKRVETRLAQLQVAEKYGPIPAFLLKLLNCPICLSFWIALFLFLFGAFPFWAVFACPVPVLLIFKLMWIDLNSILSKNEIPTFTFFSGSGVMPIDRRPVIRSQGTGSET